MSTQPTFAIDTSGREFCLSLHAADRLREMNLTVEHARVCILEPDSPPRSSVKYPHTVMWDRADLTLSIAVEGDAGVVLTALPRTREAWLDLYESGDLGSDRDVRDVDQMISKAFLKQRGAYRPFPPGTREIGELKEACHHARLALLRNPANGKTRQNFDRLRAQLAQAMQEAS